MKIYNLIILPALCFSIQVQAQTPAKKDSTSLTRELTLEREYNPSINDASKVSTLPEIKEPEAPKAQVEFAKYTLPFEVKPQLNPFQAESYFTDIPYSKKRGYLTAGVGSFVDIDGDLGYQILNSDKDQLSLFGSHRSSNGKVSYLQNDKKQKMKINDNLLGFDYTHNFGNLRLNTNAKYTYSGFNYYGYTMEPFEHWVPNDPVFNIDKDINQANNLFEINAGIINDKPNDLNYMLRLGYSRFQQKYGEVEQIDGAKENRFRIDWDMHKGFNSNMSIGLGGNFKNYSYTTPEYTDVVGMSDFSTYDNYTNVALNPYFGMEGDNWDVRLGVILNLSLGLFDNYTRFSPDIRFTYRPSEKFKFYLITEGGVTDNGNYSMYYENRYMSPNIRTLDSKSSFDGTLGIQASPINNLWFDIFTGYKLVDDEHFFATGLPLTELTRLVSHSETTLLGGSMIYPFYMDAKVFKLGAGLKYQFQNTFDFGLKATYYNWNVDSKSDYVNIISPDAWNKPTFVTDLNAGYNFEQLGIPIRLDLLYHLESGRRALGERDAFNVKMKNINNLSAKGTYYINDTFSLFAKVNNLLFQNYDIFYGYPAQNFSIMGGISIRF